jgi:hypothetical protein
MAKKLSREKKLYRHDGRYFFKSNNDLEDVQMIERDHNEIASMEISLSYIHGYHENTKKSVDDDLSREFHNLVVSEVERPPPIPPLKLLKEYSAMELVALWD